MWNLFLDQTEQYIEYTKDMSAGKCKLFAVDKLPASILLTQVKTDSELAEKSN